MTPQSICAVTFTNKAANEMKHRIIDWLKKFSMPGYETNQDLINIREKLKNDGYFIYPRFLFVCQRPTDRLAALLTRNEIVTISTLFVLKNIVFLNCSPLRICGMLSEQHD